MIPITAIVLIEYFVIDIGGTKWLEYLPSISWSTWPYVTSFSNFGDFISEVIELAYLIPNAAPEVIYHYCTGVLWTIPVQLQGSWLVLLGVVVIREIKTPWKRFAYYAFCIVQHWYARSWGSFLWMGLLLADLDVTFSWKQWLYARPAAYYSVLVVLNACWILGIAPDVAAQSITYNFAAHENNIHPDIASGLPLRDTPYAGYPAYFNPRFNGLFFAVGLQAVVELSPVLQRILSLKVLMVLFPHILTIYLIHGLIFWSWGAWICVLLARIGLVYWLNLFITAITSYAIIALSLPFLTPIIESLGRSMTAQIWEFATKQSPPRRKTMYPFRDDIFLGSKVPGAEIEKGDIDKMAIADDVEKLADAKDYAIRKSAEFEGKGSLDITYREMKGPGSV
ncbi:hypothetical protein LTS18_012979 [Coniosporium uncinatum]|uniref:Uncharacterized protein n=1 Tax=Coniosporium uncinatum TaxID=93489 RepID=A0ACC3CXA5_9PEZI|nr:hypothetical protein LTS18_012979 [Coniosporium uncinatum]